MEASDATWANVGGRKGSPSAHPGGSWLQTTNKELIELLVERMAGRWRELSGSDEKRFRSRLAFGQSHAESSSANVARENAPGGEYFNGLLTPPNTGEGTP